MNQLIDLDCPSCGQLHDPQVCCHCGDDRHDDDFCCRCGHFHQDGDCPSSPCGDHRCCIN